MACSKPSQVPIHLLSAKYLAELPPAILLKNLKVKGMTCIKCKKLPYPEYFKVCQENGHVVCGSCSVPELIDAKYPPKSYTASLRMKPDCCSPEWLEEGRPVVMQRLIECAKWECVYKKNGCTLKVSGKDWEDHIKNCTYQYLQECYYYGCEVKTHELMDTLLHYVKDHNGDVLSLGDDNERLVTFTFEEGECKIKRKVGILKDKDGNYYLFAVQMFNNGLLMWMWDMSKIGPNNQKTYDQEYRLVLYVPRKDSHEKAEISFKGVVQPLTKSCESIIGSHVSRDCFKQCMDTLKMICYKNWREVKSINEWTCKITLLNREPVLTETNEFVKQVKEDRKTWDSYFQQ